MNRPITTLYMLMSLDGKISTGDNDTLDFDKDLPNIDGVKQGLNQYYEIEQSTDLWSFNTGRVQEKMGVNNKYNPDKSIVSFVLLDNNHLSENGIKYFCDKSDKFVLITSNNRHPAYNVKEDNLYIIYQEEINLTKAFEILYREHNCERLTIQSGGTINSILFKEKLIDYVDIVVAPLIVGGKDTSTLVDGKSISNIDELCNLTVLELIDSIKLDNSYLRLKYKVKH